MNEEERDKLVEEVASAWRGRDPRSGRAMTHHAWLDLDAAGRQRAFTVAEEQRALEAAIDPEGLSTTGRAILARIKATQP